MSISRGNIALFNTQSYTCLLTYELKFRNSKNKLLSSSIELIHFHFFYFLPFPVESLSFAAAAAVGLDLVSSSLVSGSRHRLALSEGIDTLGSWNMVSVCELRQGSNSELV